MHQMRIDKILSEIDKFAPWQSALQWDNVGLLLGRCDQKISKAVVCMDVDELALKLALEVGANLILSHHPLFITPQSSFCDDFILNLAEHKVGVVCAHTNLDIAPKGVNYALAKLLGLKDLRPISADEPIGLLGSVPKQPLMEFARRSKEKLGAPYAQVYPLQENVQEVAVCGGNGSSLLPMLQGKADILVSSDFKYHQILESQVSLLDVGHYWSERVALDILQKLLNKLNIETFVPQKHKIEKLEVI